MLFGWSPTHAPSAACTLTVQSKITASCRRPPVPDGLAVADNGDLYITGTSSHGLDVVTATGTYKAFISLGGVPTNCAFHRDALYVTDGGQRGLGGCAEFVGSLWRLKLPVIGLLPFQGGITNSRMTPPLKNRALWACPVTPHRRTTE